MTVTDTDVPCADA